MLIDNLTVKQVEMLDILWYGVNSYEEMINWMNSLSASDRKQAEVLQNLILLEAAETMLEESEYHDANRVIDQFRLTK